MAVAAFVNQMEMNWLGKYEADKWVMVKGCTPHLQY